jgi:hypothetical protein
MTVKPEHLVTRAICGDTGATWPGWCCCGGGNASRRPSARSRRLRPRAASRGPRGLALAVGGVALMAAGGWLAVGGAERVVMALGLTDTAVGLTMLALATTAELFALAWAAMRRSVSEIAVAGVVGSVAYNATATLGVAALVRPLAVTGLFAPAIAAAALPLALLAITPRGRLSRPAGALLVIGYAVWVAAVLARLHAAAGVLLLRQNSHRPSQPAGVLREAARI